MDLTLTAEEQQLLLHILEQRHREMLTEISHTHHQEFKATVRRNEKVLESLLNRLRGAAVEVHA